MLKKQENTHTHTHTQITLKNKKAITLIALVITIIVLIILAGVAINLTLGDNGIFNKAKYAKEEYLNAKIQEEIELANLESEINVAERTGNIEVDDPNKLYLYKSGKTYDTTTDGWDLLDDGVSETIIRENCIYLHRIGHDGGGWVICTNKAVDITGYTKLCCKYTASSDIYNDGLILKLKEGSKTNNKTGGNADGNYYSHCFEFDKTNEIFEWDISSITSKEYYIAIGGSGATDTYIYEVWLEK